jgi:CheY-like chemotaxis protein
MEQKKKVLIIEEELEIMRDLQEHLIEELGLEVEMTAEKGILKRLSEVKFDLLLVDLMIQPTSYDQDDREVNNIQFEGINWRKTGLEFIRRLRNGDFSTSAGQGTSPNAPVIILSAVANDSVSDDDKKTIGVKDFVEKPFRLADVVEVIKKNI